MSRQRAGGQRPCRRARRDLTRRAAILLAAAAVAAATAIHNWRG